MGAGVVYVGLQAGKIDQSYLQYTPYFQEKDSINVLGLSKLLRLGEGRAVKRLDKIADQVMALDDEYSKLTDEELRAKTDSLKKRVQEDGEDLDDVLLEAFATARDASRSAKVLLAL